MTGQGPRTLRVHGLTAALLALGALGFVLVLVASASGPVGFVTASTPNTRESLPSVTPSSSPVTLRSRTTSAGIPPQMDLPALPALVVLLIQVLIWAATILLLVLLVRAVWRHAPRWRSRVQSGTGMTTLPDVPEELTRSADARMALLGAGTPRNAIVACWLDLEGAAGSVGLPREPSETSAEYTTRVLSTWDISPDALSGLAELYREARFSRHSLTEEHRAGAIARLTRLHDDLRRVADERAAARAAEAAPAAGAGAASAVPGGAQDGAPGPSRTDGTSGTPARAPGGGR